MWTGVVRWAFSFNNPDLFMGVPSASIRDGPNGTLIGVLTLSTFGYSIGQSTFNVTLIDDGPGDPRVGHQNASQKQTFIVRVQARNQPPSFSLLSQIDVLENLGLFRIDGFAYDISTGPDTEMLQKYTLTLDNVDPRSSFWGGESVFSSFKLFTNGTLVFHTAANVNGEFQLSVRMQDNGGLTFQGQDSEVQRTMYA